MANAELSKLETLARTWAVPMPGSLAEGILGFVRMLLEWNARINLTGADSCEDVIGEHLVDSFALAHVVSAGSSVVDVGSGGGLPALPFALLRPDCALTMVEPRAKRVAFLRAACRGANLGQRVIVTRGRGEDLPGGSFGCACSRATFAPGDWLRFGAGLVRAGGQIIVLASEELSAQEPGVKLEQGIPYATAAGRGRWLGVFRREP